MQYQNLPLLHIFHRVVALGSFQAAAQQLNLPRSSVSKKIVQLEHSVGQPLLLRSTRRLHLTDAGRDLLANTVQLHGVVESLESAIQTLQSVPQGRVKVSASVLMGQGYLVPLLAELRRQFPRIALDLNLDDRNVDLIANEVDIAIRVGHLPDSSLIARQIGQKRWGWFASDDYLSARGEPLVPGDLSQHECLVYGSAAWSMSHWPFQNEAGETLTLDVLPAYRVDNSRVLVDMACAGLGVIMADPIFIRQELAMKQLRPILTQWSHPDSSPIHLVCLRQKSKAAQAVWQYLLVNLRF